MGSTRSPIIELQDVALSFGEKVLIEHASLSVYEGETLAIIGESGCGKSVLMKMFIGLLEPDEGRVLFKGKDLAEMDQSQLDAARKQVGYVFQNDALFDSMSVVDNVGYAMREHSRATDEQVRARALECLGFVGLQERVLDLYPSDLSGGMRKRVGIMRAIADKPEILLYDEPTQGLDPQSITRIAETIERLQRDLRATSVIVTHDLRTAFGVSDRIALMHDHSFPYVGTPVEMFRDEAEPVREFIEDAMAELQTLPALADALAAHA